MAAGIEHRHLRSALEYAVAIAAEGQKRKPPLAYPRELKPFFGKARIPTSALGKVRRAIEADETFRSRIAVGAIPELVDEIGRLWLERPSGWESRAAELVAAADEEAATADLQSALRRAEKRREAAETGAARLSAELSELHATVERQRREVDDLHADLVKASDELAEMRAEVIDVRNEARHARDREAAAADKLAAVVRERDEALARSRSAADVRDDVLRARAEDAADRAELLAAFRAARDLADRLGALVPRDPSDDGRADRPARRAPMALPGGVSSSSPEAATFFARSDAAVLVDGYNVAMLGWPQLDLAGQREALLDALENLARRYGTDLTVVFDGATVVGAHAHRRRLVRVVFSPEGVIADDVIRDEVGRLPTSRPVVVVTNDAEIVRDVRADGANTLPSDAFLAALG